MRKNAWDVANEIRFKRQVHKGALLIIEGNNDARIFPKFVNETKCPIIVADGRPNALEAVEYLRDWGITGYVAVIDADFDHINGIDVSDDDVIVTEFHDIDTVVFESSALTNFLRERADGSKLAKIGRPADQEVRKLVYAAALGLGCLRCLSARHSWDLKFQRLRFEFINQRTIQCNDGEMVAAVLANSPNAKCSRAQLMTALARIRAEAPQPQQACNGHDVAQILGIALRDLLGGLRESQSWGSEVEFGLRLAFDAEAFSVSGLFRSIRNWEEENPTYKILALP